MGDINGRIYQDNITGQLVTKLYMADNAISASYASSGPAVSNDWSNLTNVPSGLVSGSYIDSASVAVSASYALTASYSSNVSAGTWDSITGKPTVVSESSQVNHNQTTNYESDQHFTQGNITTIGTLSSGDVSAIITGDTVLSSSYSETSSYAENVTDPSWDNVIGKPSGLVSGSSQVDHNQTTNYESDQHFTKANIDALGTVVSGDILGILPSGVVSGSLIDSSSYSTTASYALNVSEHSWDNITGKPAVVSSSIQIDHDQTTNYETTEHYLQLDITEVGTVTSGDISKILPSGTVSGSSQISYNGITDVPTGIFSSSEQVDYNSIQNQPTLIDSASYAPTKLGVISGSIQVDHDATTNFVTNEHIDWTQDQGGTLIDSNNYVATASVESASYASYAETSLSASYAPSNTDVVSGSEQIDHDLTTNFETNEHYLQSAITEIGTVTAGDVSSILPSGIISGSLIDSSSYSELSLTASYASNYDPIVYTSVSASYSTTMSIDNSSYQMTRATASANFHIEMTNHTLLKDSMVEVRYLAENVISSYSSSMFLVGGTQHTSSNDIDYFLITCINDGGEYILTILNR